MYCPRCGQEQVSEETRYCSKCGFPLGLISEVLSFGGYLPQLSELHKKSSFLTRKTALFVSFFWFVFFVPFLTSIFGGLLGVEELAILSALVGVFGSLLLLVATFVFIPKKPKTESQPDFLQQPNALAGQPFSKQNLLPHQQSISANEYIAPQQGSWRDTNDLVAPPSVTENTTKFLQKDE